ncbi:MAG TPA: AAA family ATPase [Shinella sp.]|jgi:ABC-type Na+ transport system ATPase subunit NatA|uniref:AAA family ATPase n=1 Tax=Shinella sp. TaxID=1870904 RepID=UPI002E16779D|nr:AAA family ATPase [Shinella sp.]
MHIKPSDIANSVKKVSKLNYEKYLRSMVITARAFTTEELRLDFPVTAVIGTNGGGKSTVLGSAALAYKSVKPRTFFPKSNVGDNSMSNWRIDFVILDRSINSKSTFNKNAHFTSSKWRRDEAVNRNVIFFPIQRTVPAAEQTRYKKYIGIYKAKSAIISDLDDDTKQYAGAILGRDLSGYKIARKDKKDKDSIFLGESNKKDYSQFHFGAGEASVIEMVSKIVSAPKNSLILIEELENGLHPIAVRNMTRFLVKVANENNHQVIFSTHSEDAIIDLPPEAIWACIEGKAIQGKLNIESLRAIVGSVEKSQVIFAEDEFAVDFTTEIIRQSLPSALNTLEIHKAGGYPYVCQVAQYHNNNPAIKSTAYAVVDGDQGNVEDPDSNVYCLPNGIPEKIVFDFVSENMDGLLGVMQQRCQCTQISHDEIKKRVLKVGNMSLDPHDIFSQLALELDFSSEIVIRRAFISIYVQQNKGLMAPLVSKIKDSIN